MRLATVQGGAGIELAVVRGDRLLPLSRTWAGLASVNGLADAGGDALRRLERALDARPSSEWLDLAGVALGPAVPEPGAIYAIGMNYRAPGEAASDGSPAGATIGRPLVYAKLPTSVAGSGAPLTWDRQLTSHVDAECELGVVIGHPAVRVPAEQAMAHVFGYTCVDDVSSRDPWLDGDQWLLGKSMAGFCPVGPWIVTADELDPADLRLGCAINGEPIQDGRTSAMRHTIPELISFLSRHVELRPGDLIATGTPARLSDPPGPDRHLEPGDLATAWIEGIGELTTPIG
jgi:2,4-didehydro-3-deoxy-L-rhamnonate hydrolase